jgi:hypothetical protein
VPVQATADYFEEEDSTRADGWKLPRVMMWLQKKHSGCSVLPRVAYVSRLLPDVTWPEVLMFYVNHCKFVAQRSNPPPRVTCAPTLVLQDASHLARGSAAAAQQTRRRCA